MKIYSIAQSKFIKAEDARRVRPSVPWMRRFKFFTHRALKMDGKLGPLWAMSEESSGCAVSNHQRTRKDARFVGLQRVAEAGEAKLIAKIAEAKGKQV